MQACRRLVRSEYDVLTEWDRIEGSDKTVGIEWNLAICMHSERLDGLEILDPICLIVLRSGVLWRR